MGLSICVRRRAAGCSYKDNDGMLPVSAVSRAKEAFYMDTFDMDGLELFQEPFTVVLITSGVMEAVARADDIP